MTPATAHRLDARWLLPGLLLLLLALAVLASGLGFIAVSLGQVLKVVASRLPGLGELSQGLDQVLPHVVWEVRLPRILPAATVGAGLAMSGAVFQGILLNPLADPYTLGISSGAAFGASLCLILGLDFWGAYSVCLLAFLGAVLTLLAVIWLSSQDGQVAPNNLILSGVIVAAILSAGIGLIKYLADEQVTVIIFWLMGSLVSKGWLDFVLTLGAGLVGLLVFLYHARDLNLPCLGARAAASLGGADPAHAAHTAHHRLPGSGGVRGCLGHHRLRGALDTAPDALLGGARTTGRCCRPRP